MDSTNFGTYQKALALNLETSTYSTFAEIGAGQEVARWFFSVGGAAGTVAKTISAYDMAVSNGLYGSTQNYVSRQRLEAMLEQEYLQLEERLGYARGDTKRFFVFADTTATRSYRQPGNGRGWVGIRFQAEPRSEPPDIHIHVHLSDSTAARQQEALGIVGINLVHAAFHRRNPSTDLLSALMDGLLREQVEIDMVKLAGLAFAGVVAEMIKAKHLFGWSSERSPMPA